jgi:hypothetical protein
MNKGTSMKTVIKTPGAICSTSGTGHWTSEKRQVGIKSIELCYTDDELGFANIVAFFKTGDWNTEKHGLIYTDRKWLANFRKLCNSLGLPGCDVDYTEQGMQGTDYVSLCVGKKFLKAWAKVTGQEVEADYYCGV